MLNLNSKLQLERAGYSVHESSLQPGAYRWSRQAGGAGQAEQADPQASLGPEFRSADAAWRAAMDDAIRCGVVKGVALRDLARSIEQHIQSSPVGQVADVHWIAVVGESSVDRAPTRHWDQKLDDSMLTVAVQQGHSEGYLLHVQAVLDRYNPNAVDTLFRLKILGGGQQGAFQAAQELFKFLHSAEWEEAVQVVHLDPDAELAGERDERDDATEERPLAERCRA